MQFVRIIKKFGNAHTNERINKVRACDEKLFFSLNIGNGIYAVANEYQSTLAISKRRLSAGVCLCLLSAQAESMVAKDSAGVGAKHKKSIQKIRNIHHNTTRHYINNRIRG